jgi:hypothetical protein
MFKKLMILALIQGLLGTAAFAEYSTCLMADRQQQNLILNEAPKALRSESTTECFKSLVKDEMAVLKEGESPMAGDNTYVVQSMMQSALERYTFDKTQAE